MKTIDVEDLLKPYENYADGWSFVNDQVNQGLLIPVKNSGSNGMKPPLYQRYRRPAVKKDNRQLLLQLKQEVLPPLSVSHYRTHLAQFEKDRPMILQLQAWLADHPEPPAAASVNERSFEIFHQEKVLACHGQRLLKNLKIHWDRLQVYETCEPVSSYSASRTPGPILIVENLDPFVTVRRLLMEGQKTICGMPVSTVVYGAGKNIVRTFRDLLEFGPAEIQASLDQVYYWGDLDWEGLQIYESLCARWPEQTFHLFLPGYLAMLVKAEGYEDLPLMKEGQRENWNCPILAAFEPSRREQLSAILKNRTYIPQEILGAADYREEGKHA